MLFETLLTALAVVVLVVSGIVALPWTSFELRGSALAYHTLARLTHISLNAAVTPLRVLAALELRRARHTVTSTITSAIGSEQIAAPLTIHAPR